MKEINDASFNTEVLDSEKVVVVDFWAPWCGPCKMLGPVLEEIDKEYGDKIKFVKVDVDQNPQVAGKYEIFSIPTIMIFKQGAVADKQVGFVPKNVLEDKFKKYL